MKKKTIFIDSPNPNTFMDLPRQSKNDDSEEMKRLKRNIDTLTDLVIQHKKQIHELNAHKMALQENFVIELKTKSQQLEEHENAAADYQTLQKEHKALKDEHAVLGDLHANEQARADKLHQLHSLSHQEKNELSDMADDIINGLENGDLSPKGRHDLEVKILNHINKLKGEIDQQDNVVSQLENDLAAEKELVKRLESDVAQLENGISDHARQYRLLKKDKEQLMKNQASLEKDLDFFESELKTARGDHQQTKNENAKLNDAIDITTREHAKLRDIHDTLLADFKAGNYEQFRKDLDTKLASFDNLIDEQEAELKDLKSQKDSQYKTINENLEALILDASNETREIASLKKYQTKLLQSFRGGAVSTKRSKSRSPSRYNGY